MSVTSLKVNNNKIFEYIDIIINAYFSAEKNWYMHAYILYRDKKAARIYIIGIEEKKTAACMLEFFLTSK